MVSKLHTSAWYFNSLFYFNVSTVMYRYKTSIHFFYGCYVKIWEKIYF